MKATIIVLVSMSGLLQGDATSRKALLDFAKERASIESRSSRDLKEAAGKLIKRLEVAKTAATKRGNLDAAVAIDAKIKAAKRFQNRTPADLVKALVGTKWSLHRDVTRTHKPSITFGKGFVVVSDNPKAVTVATSANTIETEQWEFVFSGNFRSCLMTTIKTKSVRVCLRAR